MEPIIGDVDRPVQSNPHPYADTIRYLFRHVENECGPAVAQNFQQRANERTGEDFLLLVDETTRFLDLHGRIQR